MTMSRYVLAIDPGNVESAWARINQDTCRPLDIGKAPNDRLRAMLASVSPTTLVAVEMIASYGMPVGKEVFDTVLAVGRYQQIVDQARGEGATLLVYRKDVKVHHCGTTKAKDANVTQALVDRFASGVSNKGKGTVKAPGWFYGFRADIWQAYAVAVLVADVVRPDVAVSI
jgi:hypothetical protein